jgi:hypothetical protein
MNSLTIDRNEAKQKKDNPTTMERATHNNKKPHTTNQKAKENKKTTPKTKQRPRRKQTCDEGLNKIKNNQKKQSKEQKEKSKLAREVVAIVNKEQKTKHNPKSNTQHQNKQEDL